ncbi:hypothetical protein [Pseudorhodobacter aquimaris]|uniref:hypothetical protein n=1 Tax=Pseudorhodobacter aquimaris TaxID=687412 RepID=UPI00067CAD5E|nr:hypothetical protein [Pseudorhodobacter aquimaris]
MPKALPPNDARLPVTLRKGFPRAEDCRLGEWLLPSGSDGARGRHWGQLPRLVVVARDITPY